MPQYCEACLKRTNGLKPLLIPSKSLQEWHNGATSLMTWYISCIQRRKMGHIATVWLLKQAQLIIVNSTSAHSRLLYTVVRSKACQKRGGAKNKARNLWPSVAFGEWARCPVLNDAPQFREIVSSVAKWSIRERISLARPQGASSTRLHSNQISMTSLIKNNSRII